MLFVYLPCFAIVFCTPTPFAVLYVGLLPRSRPARCDVVILSCVCKFVIGIHFNQPACCLPQSNSIRCSMSHPNVPTKSWRNPVLSRLEVLPDMWPLVRRRIALSVLYMSIHRYLGNIPICQYLCLPVCE